jgi:chorismate mutase/prephenate dehydratase
MAEGEESEIVRLRRAIDEVDDRLLGELDRRAELARQVAEWKRARGKPYHAPERERQVLDRLASRAHGAFPSDAVRPVFLQIIGACLALEQRLKVGYLGPEATFAHQAARGRFGLGAQHLPQATTAQVLGELERGPIELGVVPTEGGAEGLASHTYELLAERALAILEELELQPEHCLLGRAPLDELRKVYGHPEALARCRGWLTAHAPQAAPLEVAQAAMAGRLAQSDPQAAAVAPELGAQLFDLPVAARAIDDERPQAARFLVVGKPELAPAPSGRDRTTLLLAVADQPGALARALAPFAAHKVNLSRVESRPPRRGGAAAGAATWWTSGYAFVDCDGHAADARVDKALAALREEGALGRVLGSYPRAPEENP